VHYQLWFSRYVSLFVSLCIFTICFFKFFI
jgi:hypothetical protein